RVGRGPERRARADNRVRFVDEKNQIVAFFDFVDDAFDSFFKHAAQHGAGDDAAHLQLHHVRVAQTRRNFLWLEFDHARESFNHGGLTNAGLADQHRRIRSLAMTKNLDNLLNLFFTANGWWNFV